MRTFVHTEFDAQQLLEARGERTISVCMPARNEESTIGHIVSAVRDHLTARGATALVEEILVVDDGSTDQTASVAARAGARVVTNGPGRGGKGEAMRLAIAESDGDLLVFLDADVGNFRPHFVTGLLGPLLVEPESVMLVKGFYERPIEGKPSGGGRVTELTARPVIELLYPQLREVRQPLAGESAAPRTVLEKVGIAGGYGAELGLLIDVASSYGTASVAQVDLGVRVHRNRSLEELRHQATDVLRAGLERAGWHLGGPATREQ